MNLNFFTKNKLILISLIFVLFYPVSQYLIRNDSNVCINIGGQERVVYWVTTCHLYMILSFVMFAILFFSIILFFIKKEPIFKTWRSFTFVFFILYFIIILITPWYEGDEFFAITKSLVAIAMTILYSIISLILILYKSFKKESN